MASPKGQRHGRPLKMDVIRPASPNGLAVAALVSGGWKSGGLGPEDAEDPVDRASSAVQAVAIFYPVTDLLNMGDSTENLGAGLLPLRRLV